MHLIKDLTDPIMRIDVASTINFLSDLYNSGKISEQELAEDLTDVCTTVFKKTRPDLADVDLDELVKKEVEDFIRVIKLSGLRRRLSSKYSIRL